MSDDDDDEEGRRTDVLDGSDGRVRVEVYALYVCGVVVTLFSLTFYPFFLLDG